MNAPSPNSTETFASADAPSSEQPLSIAESIARCAVDARHPIEFLQRVAGEMASAFDVGIVAVEVGNRGEPEMLVSDPMLGVQIDRKSVCELLASATTSPIACEIALSNHGANAGEESAAGTRGLTVRVSDSPRPTAFLLIYRAQEIPPPVEQIHHLKQLNLFADAIRSSIAKVPGEFTGPAVNHDGVIGAESWQPGAAFTSRPSLQLFHQDLDVDATAYRIANESRRLLQCDRVTVLLPRANRYRVRAISGISVFDSRSNSVRCTEQLAYYASAMARPMFFPSDDPLPPQIQEPLDAYLDETGTRAAIMLPLHREDEEAKLDETASPQISPFEGTGEIIAILMLEYFSGDPAKTVSPEINLVSSEAVIALRNSLEHQKVFGLRLWKFLGATLAALHRPLVAVAVLAVISLLVASALIPVEHYVVATGTSQPARERQVFAGVDGVVKKIHVRDGQRVEAGQPILELENSELENRAESISGEIITAAQRLSSIEAVRLSGDGDASQSSRLVLEERQLQGELKNLRQQQALIKQQQANLVIRSPIQGTVVAWQLERRLSDRPVSRGNLLVSVVDHSGPWLLRLTVPDENAGPVLDSLQRSEKQLPVRFAVATMPDVTYAAALESVASATRLDESGQHVLDVVARVNEFDADEISARSLVPFDRKDIRVGADVTAKIACGERSILRSWFSDVFDFVDRNVVFYFR